MDHIILSKVEKFFSQFEIKTYAKGEIITMANQEPSSVSFLQAGTVEQYDITSAGNRVTVNIFRTPSFFPMSWAINKTPNIYFFGAVTKVTVRQADPAATVLFLRHNPDVLFNLLSRVYLGTDVLLRRLALEASGIAINRLIYELLGEAYRFGISTASPDLILISVKQHALAARSGLARETVNRELHKLAKLDLLELTKEGIVANTVKLEKQLDQID